MLISIYNYYNNPCPRCKAFIRLSMCFACFLWCQWTVCIDATLLFQVTVLWILRDYPWHLLDIACCPSFCACEGFQVINTPLIPQTRRDYLNRDLDIYARFKLWVHLHEAAQKIKRLSEVAVGEDRLVRVHVNVAEYLERRGIALFGDCQFAGFHGSLSPFLVDYGILMPCCGHFERI